MLTSLKIRNFKLFDEVARAVAEIEGALRALGDQADPWGPDIKASDEFLDRVFRKFYGERLKIPDLMRKTDYHTLVPFVPLEAIDEEIREKLDAIAGVASIAKPRR